MWKKKWGRKEKREKIQETTGWKAGKGAPERQELMKKRRKA